MKNAVWLRSFRFRRLILALWLSLPIIACGCSQGGGANAGGGNSGGGASTGGGDVDGGEVVLGPDEYEVEITEYAPPPQAAQDADIFVDDRLEDLARPAFDPDLIDRRPLDNYGQAWQINSSAAVLRLDAPVLKPDVDAALFELQPSYAEALGQRIATGEALPSVNQIDGKAKQFDDGLVAAINAAYFEGRGESLPGQIALIQQFYERVGPTSPAAPFLAAGLSIAGVETSGHDAEQAALYVTEFEQDATRSKPIGFYTWSEKLARSFRFVRFFQKRFPDEDLAIPLALADALAQDAELRRAYIAELDHAARMANPAMCRSLVDLLAPELAAERQIPPRLPESQEPPPVALFPAATSREYELIQNLFPLGLPPGADLMREIVRALRSGQVNLQPDPQAGWYQYQAYALETFLLPTRGAEGPKLLLSANYKRRMLEAFAALLTKRRETHVRDLAVPVSAPSPLPPPKIRPRLRLEPCPSYYLRTARAYRFLQEFLSATLGEATLNELHGLRQTGPREAPLGEELAQMQRLFYGLYLLSVEDLGLPSELNPAEVADAEAAYAAAEAWLPQLSTDADLAVDTRVSVPMYVDYLHKTTRLWLTLGVRLARLNAAYAVGPRLRPADGSSDWEERSGGDLESAEYLIAVDEFAEVTLPGLRTLTREELRAICDREQTKEKILAALSAQP